jgi:DNA-binding MarR family transcriptional regulator
MRDMIHPESVSSDPGTYILDDQIGFILRQVAQRHAAIFAAGVAAEVTSTQWAALAKLFEAGPLSQNLLGRLTVMDAATIKGVIDRLTKRGLTDTRPAPDDGRRRLVTLTEAGRALVQRLESKAFEITEETLAPLDAEERRALKALLLRLR